MEKQFWNMMDQFFTLLLIISGEDNQENTSIHHIL